MSAEDFVKLSVRYRVDFGHTRTSPLAELLFLRGMAYCGLNNTFGSIPEAELPGLAAGLRKPTALAAELEAGGYWQRSETGWCVRSWDKWQHEFDQVAEKRRRDAERKRDERRRQREQEMGDDT